MVWRGSPKVKDKLFACLTYLVPILEVFPFGFYLIGLFPPLAVVFVGFLPLLQIYYFNIGGFPIISLAIFIWLYAGVAQNPRLIHFLRYNAMQALLLSIFAALCSLVLSLLGMSQQALFGGFSGNFAGSSNFLLNTINSVIFLFVAGSSIFSVVQCIRGLYAEIPVISEAAYSQVR
ncbi:hypothetical protein HC931_26710 [Candidatus Gracilibacteria bacterium]|nr:hypothetical protein [Candidatus Gracilibacteria bacterium]NJM89193.1 hypothetical protein [Hydrococcus sp. RU_2_2]NJP21145.1 hypothetical protein [Hydrococcus sp. CRU_1_1]